MLRPFGTCIARALQCPLECSPLAFSVEPMGDSSDNSPRCLPIVLAALVVAVAFVAVGQSRQPSNSALLRGTIRDSAGTPLKGARLRVLSSTAEVSAFNSDSNGAYRSPDLPPGDYTIRIAKDGFRETSFGPFLLEKAQVRTIDLKLDPVVAVKGADASAGKPEFYDEPQFTVAGVSDAMNHGGHGADVTSRTSQVLTREVSALHNSAAGEPSAPAAAAEQSLRKTLERAPEDFSANCELGALLAAAGRPAEAIPFLERARQMRRDDYGSAYQLAQAYSHTGRDQDARRITTELLARHDKAELHHLLAELDERHKDPLSAVHEYQRAAELEPTEANLFDWGTELLTHRTFQPAIEVFSRGHMLLGLAVALYATGANDLAAKCAGEASDLEPSDPPPYVILGKMAAGDKAASPAVIERLARFARLHPDSAEANYYYAVALWKRGSQPSTETAHQVESLLEDAHRLDPKLAGASLQLGVVYEQRQELSKAISAYQSASVADPQLKEAHYRLAQLYRRTGEKEKAGQELAIYTRLSQQAAAQNEREAQEIPQFVYTLRDSKAPALPQ